MTFPGQDGFYEDPKDSYPHPEPYELGRMARREGFPRAWLRCRKGNEDYVYEWEQGWDDGDAFKFKVLEATR